MRPSLLAHSTCLLAQSALASTRCLSHVGTFLLVLSALLLPRLAMGTEVLITTFKMLFFPLHGTLEPNSTLRKPNQPSRARGLFTGESRRSSSLPRPRCLSRCEARSFPVLCQPGTGQRPARNVLSSSGGKLRGASDGPRSGPWASREPPLESALGAVTEESLLIRQRAADLG